MLACFSLRCKFGVGDTWRGKLGYCFLCFSEGHERAGMLHTLQQAQSGKPFWMPWRSLWMLYLESLLCSSGLSFLHLSGMHLLCLQRETWIKQGNDSIFSARGRNVGEVSLKVVRTHALSILSPSLEISRKKISNELRGVIGLAGYKVRALWPCSEQRRSWCSVRSQGQH